MGRILTWLSIVFACCTAVACIGPPSDSDWGDAAWDAVADADVWGPTAGAGLFLLSDFDHRATRWAVDRQPLFGSIDSAKKFSDRTAIGLGLLSGLSLFAVDHEAHPTALEADGWIAATALLGPGPVKNLIGRPRPAERDRDSTPSGHAVSSFAFASALSHDLDRMPMFEGREGAKLGLRTLAYTVAGASSWARVEAERHHPADILLGAAMGNFLTRFVNNLYTGRRKDDHVDGEAGQEAGQEAGVSRLSPIVVPGTDEWIVGASWRF